MGLQSYLALAVLRELDGFQWTRVWGVRGIGFWGFGFCGLRFWGLRFGALGFRIFPLQFHVGCFNLSDGFGVSGFRF